LLTSGSLFFDTLRNLMDHGVSLVTEALAELPIAAALGAGEVVQLMTER
jgi:hypothetical protein